MRVGTFSILTALAVIYAGLTVTETFMYQRWDHAQAEQRDIQNRVTYFHRLDEFIQTVLRRLAVESQRDPALLEILKQNKINVVVNTPTPATGTTGTPASAPADKPAQTPPSSQGATPANP